MAAFTRVLGFTFYMERLTEYTCFALALFARAFLVMPTCEDTTQSICKEPQLTLMWKHHPFQYTFGFSLTPQAYGTW